MLARNNWWGRNHVSFVAGRIWERRDDDNLIRVEYQPFLPDNTSVLHGMIQYYFYFIDLYSPTCGSKEEQNTYTYVYSKIQLLFAKFFKSWSLAGS